jgi:chitinase
MQSSIDFIWIQFYNNPSCKLDTGQDFVISLESWSADLSGGSNLSSWFIDVGNGVTSPRIFIGAPAFAAAGSGYVDQDQFQTIMQSVPTTQITNLGGVRFWGAAYGEQNAMGGVTYMQIVKDVLGQPRVSGLNSPYNTSQGL